MMKWNGWKKKKALVSAESLVEKSCLNWISHRGLGVFEGINVLEYVFYFFTPGPLRETRLGLRQFHKPKAK